MVADVQSGWLDNPASNFGWLVLGDETAIRHGKAIRHARERQSARPSRIGGTLTPTVTRPQQLHQLQPYADRHRDTECLRSFTPTLQRPRDLDLPTPPSPRRPARPRPLQPET